MDFDGFDDFDLQAFTTSVNREDSRVITQDDELSKSILQKYHRGEGNIVYRRTLPVNLVPVIDLLYQLHKKEDRPQLCKYLQYMVMELYGKRNIKKEIVSAEELTDFKKAVYGRIREELQRYPGRYERIYDFVNQKGITARLINYFIVRYILLEQKVSYYLDKTSYPFQIVGRFNDEIQPEILKRIEQGEHIVWINLHQEYKVSKSRDGRRNLHSPYQRGDVVRDEKGRLYSLCELNFYLWMDDVGGMEAFRHYQDDVVKKKSKYNEEKRIFEATRSFGKRKKHKVVLRKTDGRNYQTFMLEYTKAAPYTGLEETPKAPDATSNHPFGNIYLKQKPEEPSKIGRNRKRRRYVSVKEDENIF